MTKELSKGFTGIEINGVRFSNISEMLQYMDKQRERIAELEKSCDETQELLDKQIEATLKLQKENAELNTQLSDVLECFISASSGDDFEMAESAREVMEVLNIRCYRHGEVKSKLTNAKEIIREFMKYEITEYDGSLEIHFEELKKQAEQFLKESEVEND